MKSFLKWLALSPTASLLKIALASTLALGLDAIDSFHLPAALMLVITIVVPVVIDALNPQDPRFGKGKAPTLKDFLEALLAAAEEAKHEVKPVVDAVESSKEYKAL